MRPRRVRRRDSLVLSLAPDTRPPMLAVVVAEGTTTDLEGTGVVLGAMRAEATKILWPVSPLLSHTTVVIMGTMGTGAAMDSQSQRTRRASRGLEDRLVSRRRGGGMETTMISMADGEQ